MKKSFERLASKFVERAAKKDPELLDIIQRVNQASHLNDLPGLVGVLMDAVEHGKLDVIPPKILSTIGLKAPEITQIKALQEADAVWALRIAADAVHTIPSSETKGGTGKKVAASLAVADGLRQAAGMFIQHMPLSQRDLTHSPELVGFREVVADMMQQACTLMVERAEQGKASPVILKKGQVSIDKRNFEGFRQEAWTMLMSSHGLEGHLQIANQAIATRVADWELFHSLQRELDPLLVTMANKTLQMVGSTREVDLPQRVKDAGCFQARLAQGHVY